MKWPLARLIVVTVRMPGRYFRPRTTKAPEGLPAGAFGAEKHANRSTDQLDASKSTTSADGRFPEVRQGTPKVALKGSYGDCGQVSRPRFVAAYSALVARPSGVTAVRTEQEYEALCRILAEVEEALGVVQAPELRADLLDLRAGYLAAKEGWEIARRAKSGAG